MQEDGGVSTARNGHNRVQLTDSGTFSIVMEAAAESKLCHRARGEWMMDRPKHALIQEKATTIAHARCPKKARGERGVQGGV